MTPAKRALHLVPRIAVAVAVLLILSAYAHTTPRPRLVLVYATCTLNREYLSPYNPAVTYTPFLDELSRRAVVFDQHFAEAGRSSIDYATLFTGQNATGHGIYFNGASLRDTAYTMAEAFRDGGYDTFFWNGHPFASVRANYGQGFSPDHIFDGNGTGVTTPYSKRGFLRANDSTFAAVLDNLRADPEYRAFLLTNFSVTHGPYADDELREFCARYPAECEKLPKDDYAKYRDLFARNFGRFTQSFRSTARRLGLSDAERAILIELADVTYRSNVWRLDRLFGEVMEAIRQRGLLDDTLVVFTTDHGELLYRENLPYTWTHGFDLAPEVLHIPLLMAGPRIPSGRYEEITRSVDVFPTIAALAGAPPPVNSEGEDLSTVLAGRAPAPSLVAFSHTALSTGGNPDMLQVAIRDRERTYSLFNDAGNFTPAVYDPAERPYGSTNEFDPADPKHARRLEELEAYKRRLIAGFLQRAKTSRPLTDEEIERLRALGYGDS